MDDKEALDILNYTIIKLARGNGKNVYAGALMKAVEALGNADKYRWHDLRKDPNDLPENYGECNFLCETKIKRKYNDFTDYSHAIRVKLTDDKFYWSDTRYGYLNHPVYKCGSGGDETLDVIAWREIELLE